jgi:hypothetical protein
MAISFAETTKAIYTTADAITNTSKVWVIASSDEKVYYGSHETCADAREFILRGQITTSNFADQALRAMTYFTKDSSIVMTLDDLKAKVLGINDTFKNLMNAGETPEIIEIFDRRQKVTATFLAALEAVDWKPERVAEEEAEEAKVETVSNI